ncbi:helix-turn-helix transcriptional regulator [Streptococcus sp. S784/96/1]|uniref:helix-turn-helix transcriptional regulator n=1 Tax=Streptococcus sp. S784/96/1 TaxID=2653499 RepID=UPI00138A071A|nr:AraC family transcriptional regulator [Streptococcus sp. S784/96/1]
MSKYSRFLKDNPSGFPFDYEKNHIQNGYPNVMYHWHPELEIIFVHNGTASYHINSEQFESQAGDIILIQPTAMHAIHPLDNREEHSTVFRIHLDNLGRNNIETFSQRYIQPLHSGHFHLVSLLQPSDTGYSDIKNCLLSIFALIEEQSLYYDMLLKAKLHELLYLLFKHRHVNRHYTDDTYQKYQKLKDLIHFLQENYDKDISIEQLAKDFGYSKNHFMSIFKLHTGSSCMDFLIQLRLNKACEALIHSLDPISEIAKQVGFNNLSNFNRQFKQRYHMTPHHYRKQKK